MYVASVKPIYDFDKPPPHEASRNGDYFVLLFVCLFAIN